MGHYFFASLAPRGTSGCSWRSSYFCCAHIVLCKICYNLCVKYSWHRDDNCVDRFLHARIGHYKLGEQALNYLNYHSSISFSLQLFSMKPDPPPPPCWGGVLICAWPVAAIVSVMVQCFITGWRIDHRKPVLHRRRGNRARANSRPRTSREEARQRKYRYLYQVRTARGDIISQVHISLFSC